MSDFGDWEPDDALDHEPPAPEQVAYRWERLREDLEELLGRPVRTWDELSDEEQAALLALGAFIVEWLATHPDHEPTPLARAIHEHRETMDPELPSWDDLSDDDRAIAMDLVALIVRWLQREGATT